MKGHGAGKLTLAIALTIAFGPTAIAQQSPAQELLRQQERERALQEQQDATPDVRLARGSKGTGKLQGTATLSRDNLLTWNDLSYANVGMAAFNPGGRGTHSGTLHVGWSVGGAQELYIGADIGHVGGPPTAQEVFMLFLPDHRDDDARHHQISRPMEIDCHKPCAFLSRKSHKVLARSNAKF
jgi:hemolysin activation/secretion protein